MRKSFARILNERLAEIARWRNTFIMDKGDGYSAGYYSGWHNSKISGKMDGRIDFYGEEWFVDFFQGIIDATADRKAFEQDYEFLKDNHDPH